MRGGEAPKLCSPFVFDHGRRDIESYLRSVADSWRYLSRKNAETNPDAFGVVFLLPGFRAPSRLQEVLGHPHVRLVALVRKKTAVRSGCGKQHSTFYDRATPQVPI